LNHRLKQHNQDPVPGPNNPSEGENPNPGPPTAKKRFRATNQKRKKIKSEIRKLYARNSTKIADSQKKKKANTSAPAFNEPLTYGSVGPCQKGNSKKKS